MKPSLTDRQFNNALGLKESHSLSNMPPGSVYDILNMYYDERGGRKVRRGYGKAFYIGEASQVNTIHDYIQSDGTQMQLVAAGTKLFKYSGAAISTITTGLTNNKPWQMETYLDKVFMTNGIVADRYRKYDGTTLSNLAIQPPSATPTLTPQAGGTLTDTGVYKYYVTFYDSDTGFESNPYSTAANAPSATIAAPNQTIRISLVAHTANDQVTDYRIYRTAADGATLYRIAELDYATYEPVGGTGFYDDTGDTDGTIALEYDNTPPQTGSNIIIHYKDRLYMFVNDPDYGSIMIYSKNNARPFAFPITNYKPIGANDGSNILWAKVYRDVLIIYKGNGIYMLTNDPDDTNNPGYIKTISTIGIQDVYCAQTQDDFLCCLTTYGYYAWKPTEYDFGDLRRDHIGKDLKGHTDDIHWSSSSVIRSTLYETDEMKHAYFVVPHQSSTTANLWHVFDYRTGQWTLYETDHEVTAFGTVRYNNRLRLYFGDANGYVWRWDEGLAEGIGKPSTSLTNSDSTGVTYAADLLTDSGQSWTINEFVGMYLYSEETDEKVLISANTADTITHGAWTTTPTANSTYYIGRSRKFCQEFWNSKNNPEYVKRMRWVKAYFDQNGIHPVNITAYRDHSTVTMGEKTATLATRSSGWGPTGDFLWGEHWGVSTIGTKRLRFAGKFHYCSIKYWNYGAGTYFGLDGYSTKYQVLYDKTQ